MQAIGKSLGVQLHEPKKVVKKVQATQVKPPAHSLRTQDKVIAKPDNVTATKTKPVARAKSIKKNDEKVELPSKIVNIRRSLDLEKSEDSSLYVSALEEVPDDSAKKTVKNSSKVSTHRVND